MRTRFLPLLLTCSCAVAPSGHVEQVDLQASDALTAGADRSAAYQWCDVLLEASARDVELYGARPTILSRQMAIPLTAMFDAWACYDATAVGTLYGASLRRPAGEHTRANKEEAIAYAAYHTLCDQLPEHVDYFREEMRARGYDPDDTTTDVTTPRGIGNVVAQAMLASRHGDGANQLGDEVGCDGEPYSDYTMYRPVNSKDEILDPDRWQPIEFDDPVRGKWTPGFLTPHWYRVRPFALDSSDQFRPGPPPLADTEQMRAEVAEVLDFNATLEPQQKAIVEFMRDGPRSTAQSGHWLKFAQAVSRRDDYGLDQDVKLFFVVGNVAMDTFIASWDAKRYYDSSRPWTLVRYLYEGETVQGWGGPGEGVVAMPAEEWHPYSPYAFITPPFPGYVSGHSTVSGGCAEALRLFTGSDAFHEAQPWTAGELTEPGFTCSQIQLREGKPHKHAREGETCDVTLIMPTFTEAAEMAGISRVMGGYHIQADNVAGLELGRRVARFSWPRYQAYFDGTAGSVQ